MATKKVYLNTIAQLAGKFSTAFISIFLIKVLTGYLSLDNYGLYSKIYNYMSIFAAIADMGLFTITIREITKAKDDVEKVRKLIGNMMTIRISFGVIIIFLSLIIAYFLPGYNSNLALAGIFIASIFTFFGLINSAILSFLQAYLKTEYSFVSTTAGKFSNFLFLLFVVFILYPKSSIVGNPSLEFNSFLWIMGAGVVGNGVMTALIYNYARKIEKIKISYNKEIIVNMLKQSIPYGLALFLNIFYFKVDVILISILQNSNEADKNIALYSVPLKIVEVGMMFGGLFLQSMLPLFSETIHKKESNKLFDLVSKSYRILFIFGLSIVCFSLVGGYEILRLVATPDYLNHDIFQYNSLDAYRITVFVFLFYFISSIFTYILIANNEQSKLLKINLYITILNIVGNFLLIPKFSFVGSAISTVISQIVLLFFTYKASSHILKFNFDLKFNFNLILFGILASFLTYFTRKYLYIYNFNFIYVLIGEIIVFSIIFFGLTGLIYYKSKLNSYFVKYFKKTKGSDFVDDY